MIEAETESPHFSPVDCNDPLALVIERGREVLEKNGGKIPFEKLSHTKEIRSLSEVLHDGSSNGERIQERTI